MRDNDKLQVEQIEFQVDPNADQVGSVIDLLADLLVGEKKKVTADPGRDRPPEGVRSHES